MSILKIICDEGFKPERASEGACGYDLRIAQDIVVEPYQMVKVDLGFRMEVPEGHAALIIPRSSCSNWSLENTAGLIDTDYQGRVFAKIRANSQRLLFHRGDRILQMVVVPCFTGTPVVVKEFTSSTTRGENGDGSTGVR